MCIVYNLELTKDGLIVHSPTSSIAKAFNYKCLEKFKSMHSFQFIMG